uniref:Uncharacterized protein n=1 Tax=Vitrella brassicaformis TaxID=1169539 RepID=A0A7S1JZ20_9ALVE
MGKKLRSRACFALPPMHKRAQTLCTPNPTNPLPPLEQQSPHTIENKDEQHRWYEVAVLMPDRARAASSTITLMQTDSTSLYHTRRRQKRARLMSGGRSSREPYLRMSAASTARCCTSPGPPMSSPPPQKATARPTYACTPNHMSTRAFI